MSMLFWRIIPFKRIILSPGDTPNTCSSWGEEGEEEEEVWRRKDGAGLLAGCRQSLFLVPCPQESEIES